MLNCI